MPIATMSEGIEAPMTMTTVAASAMPGKDMMTSMTRMMTSEIQVRVTAASAPMMAPKNRANAVDPRPMSRE